jgi:serine/threonine protein kinase/Tol biopolymer transport system component
VKSERWEQIDKLFHAALEHEPQERAAFLAQACDGNQLLREEVESLLASHQQAESFIESPAADIAADLIAHNQSRLTAGRTVGPYKIVDLLGAGGMGEVYLAEDTRLSRRVALKLFPGQFRTEQDRLHRFEQEARAASALNHPNIITIHEIGKVDSAHFIVTEFIEGKTLRQQMDAVKLTLHDALDVAIQIAGALGAAHKAGIVHRDIKPENIMLRPDGLVKVLDFGLAKLAEPQMAAAGDEASTVVRLKTESGFVLGTVSYMSPEQARGQAVDARTDIFSVGVVIYEMVAGRAPFEGATTSDMIAAILREDPVPLNQHSRETPAELDWIVQKALAKDREERYQTIKELQIDLKRLRQETERQANAGIAPSRLQRAATRSTGATTDDLEQSRVTLTSDAAIAHADSGAPALVSARKQVKRSVALNLTTLLGTFALIALFCVASFYAGLNYAGSKQAPSQPTFRQLSFRRGTITMARFAPDGQTVVYSAAFGGSPLELFNCRLESLDSGLLKHQASIQSISPTGEMAILLDCVLEWGDCHDGTLARVPLVGGTPREIMENVYEADWSPDGKDLAVVRVVEGKYQLEYPINKVLYRKETGWIGKVRVSPKGDMIAFFDYPVIGGIAGSVMVVDLGGQLKTLSDGWKALRTLAWYPTGAEVWFSGNRSKEPDHLRAVTLSGHLRDIHTFGELPGWIYDIFRDGRVLMARASAAGGAHMIGISADSEKERDLSHYTWSTSADISADGKNLLFYEWSTVLVDTPYVYLRKLDGSNDPVQLGQGKALALSPDAKWAIALEEGPPSQLVLLPTGAGESRPLPRGEIVEYYYASWFPDGQRILLTGIEQGGDQRSYIQDVTSGQIQPITEEGIIALMVSPDGERLLSLVPDGSPDGKYFLLPLDGTRPTPIPGIGLGEVPIQWSADGRAIYVHGPDDVDLEIYRVNLSDGRRKLWKKLQPDPVGLLGVEARPGGVRITPDGKSFVYTYWTMLQHLFLIEGLK